VAKQTIAVDSAVFFHPGRQAKEVVGIDHLFALRWFWSALEDPRDAAFTNSTEPMKAFAEMSEGSAAVWKCIRSIRNTFHASREYCPEARTG
jgi:hypothetical protein